MAGTREVVKKVENCVLYSDGTIRIDNVRASYPHLDKPYEGESEDGSKQSRYTLDGMLPKSSHTGAKDLIKKVIQDLIAANEVKVPTDKWFLKNGDDSEKVEYEDHFIVKTSEYRRPSVRNRQGTILTPEEVADMFYGGCWVNMLIRPWYFNGKAKNGKTYPKRVCANLIGVQFVRDDEAFGEGRIDDEGVWDSADSDDGMGSDDGGL